MEKINKVLEEVKEKYKGLPEVDLIKLEEDLKEAEKENLARIEELKKNPEKYLIRAGIPKRYLNASLDKVILPEKYIKVAKEFLDGKYDGLFFVGEVGSGKTFLSSAIAREFILQGKKVKFIIIPELFYDLRTHFKETNGEERIIEELKEVEILIMDDLGAEKVSDFTIDRLYLIINHRYNEVLKTIITSNLDLSEIQERIHDRLASRIFEMCKRVLLPKKDLRVEK